MSLHGLCWCHASHTCWVWCPHPHNTSHTHNTSQKPHTSHHNSPYHREVGGAIPVPLDTLKPVADGIAATDASSLIPDPIAALETFTQPLVAAGMLAGAQVPSLAPLVGQLRDVFGEVCGGCVCGGLEILPHVYTTHATPVYYRTPHMPHRYITAHHTCIHHTCTPMFHTTVHSCFTPTGG